jgi:hypothetical protein
VLRCAFLNVLASVPDPRLRRPSEKAFRSVRSRLDPADLDCRLGVYFTALAAETRLFAVAVDGKTLRGAQLLVTIDAVHTQTTARLISGTLNWNYLIIVKSNQPKLLARIQALPRRQVPVAYSQPRRHLLNATPWRTEMDDRSAVWCQITALDTPA